MSEKPPIHLNPNMDNQARYDAQEPSDFFADGRAMRPRVAGTVPRGFLNEDDHLHRGRVEGGFARTLPRGMDLNLELLERGRERFGIYCTPCHDGAGGGRGIVVQRGMLPPTDFADPRLLKMPIGQIFNVVSEGVRNMPSYKKQILVRDRWAVAAYLRALQISRTATFDRIPPEVAAEKGWKGK